MEKQQKNGWQIYGYTICVISIITFLISITSLVNAIIDLRNPLYSGWTLPGNPSLASFENYKMDILKTSSRGDELTKPNYLPDDQTIHKMYESAKAEKIANTCHKAYQSIIIDSLLIVICFILFFAHWRWIQNKSKKDLA